MNFQLQIQILDHDLQLDMVVTSDFTSTHLKTKATLQPQWGDKVKRNKH